MQNDHQKPQSLIYKSIYTHTHTRKHSYSQRWGKSQAAKLSLWLEVWASVATISRLTVWHNYIQYQSCVSYAQPLSQFDTFTMTFYSYSLWNEAPQKTHDKVARTYSKQAIVRGIAQDNTLYLCQKLKVIPNPKIVLCGGVAWTADQEEIIGQGEIIGPLLPPAGWKRLLQEKWWVSVMKWMMA